MEGGGEGGQVLEKVWPCRCGVSPVAGLTGLGRLGSRVAAGGAFPLHLHTHTRSVTLITSVSPGTDRQPRARAHGGAHGPRSQLCFDQRQRLLGTGELESPRGV